MEGPTYKGNERYLSDFSKEVVFPFIWNYVKKIEGIKGKVDSFDVRSSAALEICHYLTRSLAEQVEKKGHGPIDVEVAGEHNGIKSYKIFYFNVQKGKIKRAIQNIILKTAPLEKDPYFVSLLEKIKSEILKGQEGKKKREKEKTLERHAYRERIVQREVSKKNRETELAESLKQSYIDFPEVSRDDLDTFRMLVQYPALKKFDVTREGIEKVISDFKTTKTDKSGLEENRRINNIELKLLSQETDKEYRESEERKKDPWEKRKDLEN